MKKILCLFLMTIILVGCTGQEEELGRENRKVQNTNQTTQKKDKSEQISTPKPEKPKKKNIWNKKKIISEKKEKGICYAYPSKDGKSCWLIKYKLDKNANVETVEFPSTIQGMKVTKVGPKLKDSRWETIFGIVVWSHGDEWFGTEKTKLLENVRKIVFGDTVEVIGKRCLEGLENLEHVVLPKNLKKINPYLKYSRNIQHIELSEKNKKFVMKDGMLINKTYNRILFMLTLEEEVSIPEEIEILKYMYIRKGIKSIRIHENVKEINCDIVIEEPVLMVVDEANPYYISKENCVYQQETGALTSVTITGKTVNVPEGIEKINPYISNYSIFGEREQVKKIIYPKSLKVIAGPPFIDEYVEVEYKGNIPWGGKN